MTVCFKNGRLVWKKYKRYFSIFLKTGGWKKVNGEKKTAKTEEKSTYIKINILSRLSKFKQRKAKVKLHNKQLVLHYNKY
ncbi:unnamed protein product [Blepharisma stoltei]|uniref:Uncharacterized protein n=1 Tax=Blepharisma stoltei TaxID=1481888 RepID=A0AAU9ICE8_9CILI|nr:unnamed protein product [Blepharisma stoltei]